MKLIERTLKMAVMVIFDILIICLSNIVSALLLTDSARLFGGEYVYQIITTIFISIIIYEIVFSIFDVYKNIIRYENGEDYLKYLLLSIGSGFSVALMGVAFDLPLLSFKRIVLATILTGVSVISYRVVTRFFLNHQGITGSSEEKKNLLIIGAGSASTELIKTITSTMKSSYHIVGLIDDDISKIGCTISRVKILGNRNDIVRICKENKVDTIFFTITNADNKVKKEILNICQETGASIRVLPGVADIIRNKSLFQNLRSVEIEDLLGREPIELNNKNIGELIKDKTILVTGGGGSIGSELCRQVVKYKPSTLVIFDIYENNLYNIQMELIQNHYDKEIKIVALVGSVRDKKRLENVFDKYKPYLVFHAAAHKHVPLMEKSPLEAIKNNVLGTYNVANFADKYKVKRMILISTDKAVNPTNVMGASKRLCEMVIEAKNRVSQTEYAAVRFGNVLGSNGSVIPLFKDQIKKGGPVTVTHKEITRFFMTIPEAVGLVLQAMSYAKGGEIFVLDMGEPVKIYDLATSLIKLSGLEPNVDIPIEITGLRPGEKLYEELLMNEEGLKETEHKKIFISTIEDISEEQLESKIEKLKKLLQDENIHLAKIKKTLKEAVPTYHEPEEVNDVIKNARKEIEKVISSDKKVND